MIDRSIATHRCDSAGYRRMLSVRSPPLRRVLSPLRPELGQALSTRPDILPTAYCQELSKLQDQIPPFPTRVAIRSIESQLGAPIGKIFADISQTPVAAASLGQVYKAHLNSGELVAVKVQRPGMAVSLTLDALLFKMIGGQLKRFAKARKDLLVAVNEMMDLGPIDPSVLHLQERHHSRRVWTGDESSWLRCRRRETHVRRIPLDDRLEPYVAQAGFGCISELELITLD